MEIDKMIQEYESFTSDLLAWIQQVKEQKNEKRLKNVLHNSILCCFF